MPKETDFTFIPGNYGNGFMDDRMGNFILGEYAVLMGIRAKMQREQELAEEFPDSRQL